MSDPKYRRRHLLSFSLLAIAACLSAGATCADVGEPESPPATACLLDSECFSDEICFDGTCAQTCVIDEDCAGGVCRSELRSDRDDVVDVCVAGTSSNGTEGECSEDDECVEAFDGDTRARCGIDGACFIPQLEYALLVRDTTTVDPAETPEDGGLGADIAAIYLQDPVSGEPVAWADTVLVAPANNVVVVNEPDGSSEPLTADGMCVDSAYEAAATPLGGEGGHLLVRFLDSQTQNAVNTPPDTWNVVVVEWGENCPDGELGEPDTYEILGCEASTHKAIDVERDCSTILGSGSGYLAVSPGEK